jgi:2-polyprenyl-3-methyl-5-hydroxy-6-metoxy-1,4-benzoquinol methylase
MTATCPLCHEPYADHYHQDKKRDYWQCQTCDLVFVDKSQQLNHDDEKAVYQQHENNPQDQGYRHFLNRMAQPILDRVQPASQGLDFGCGPGPTLSLMFEEAGHNMSVYDPYFANHPEALKQPYDFITSTEVFEHLSNPKTVLEQLLAIISPQGWLGIMTKRVRDKTSFQSWHYKNDPTHITFFSEQTFHWIAQHYLLELTFVDQDVVLFQKLSEEQF